MCPVSKGVRVVDGVFTDGEYTKVFMEGPLCMAQPALFADAGSALACLTELDGLAVEGQSAEFIWIRRADGTVFLQYTHRVDGQFSDQVNVVREILLRHGGVEPPPRRGEGMLDLRPGAPGLE